MLGGYQILDLRKIDLTITKTLSNITDAYVLAQLLKLRDFIDKDYDFSKPIENQLKPVLIRYRDKKNGEKNEGAMFGELAIVDNYYTFQITGRISGYLILTIKVAFQETTNAYGAKEWVINTAKIKLQDVMDDLEGNLALEGDLDVSGDLDVGGDISAIGAVEGASANFPIINNEENPSVKPIYYHPIVLICGIEDPNTILRLSFTILDNSETAYTFSSFLSKLRSIISLNSDARFSSTGMGYDSTNSAFLHPLWAENDADNEGKTKITLAKSDGTLVNFDLEDLNTELIYVFADGVNKIN